MISAGRSWPGRMFVLSCLALVAGDLAFALQAQGERPVDRVIAQGKARMPETVQKIVGGKPAAPGEYPFQVALIWSGTNEGLEYFGQFCGGSLIDESWVLTAAHCVPNTRPEEVDVYIGSNVLPDGQNTTSAGIRRGLAEGGIISHESYDENTHDNDIALLRLTSGVKDVQPTSFATAEQQALAQVGSDVTVIGWGLTSEDGTGSPTLLEAEVSVQDSEECETNMNDFLAMFPGKGKVQVTENMFCAGVQAGGVDSCQGDSGGFLGTRTEDEGFVQLGIVSWGLGCARPGLHGVYTRLSHYHDWIAETIQSF